MLLFYKNVIKLLYKDFYMKKLNEISNIYNNNLKN